MKYIDADLLRKEIERLNNLNKQIAKEQGSTDFIKGITAGYAEVLSSIDSLQQEQPKVDLEKEIEEYWVATEWSKVITLGKFKVIARYFYGLGQLNSK